MIRIASRASRLALAQASWVAERIEGETEIVTITTAGDRGADEQDKSRWVSELERALLEGRVDVAVHSAKDVPAEPASGLELVAIPERADPRDAICGARSLADLGVGARVGTSSLRRAAQLRALRHDLEIVPVRGNVDTRLRKLDESGLDALVLAVAGLTRLGREPDGILDELVPAAGQGALALEAQPGRIDRRALTALHDEAAAVCVSVERALTAALGASCNTPVGAHARWESGELELWAWVGRPDGSDWVSDRVRGAPGELGQRCAERLLAAGADELLRAA